MKTRKVKQPKCNCEMGEGELHMMECAVMELKRDRTEGEMKNRKIKKNVWGNWNGYEMKGDKQP